MDRPAEDGVRGRHGADADGAPATRLVLVSITDTVLSARLTTWARAREGNTATPRGSVPTRMGDPVTWLVAASITDTVPLLELFT